jgi:hypothetical protein
MSERDVNELADGLQREADQLERRAGELEDRAKALKEDWQRKRADQGVPGAPPPDRHEDEAQGVRSPAPQAPPSEAKTPSEGAVGPPSDSGD